MEESVAVRLSISTWMISESPTYNIVYAPYTAYEELLGKLVIATNR